MKKKLSVLLVIVMMLSLLAACGSGGADESPDVSEPSTESAEPSPEASSAPEPVEIYVSAAASLTDVIEEIAKAYMAENEHVTIVPSFGSSGTLQTQIEEGAPADIFLSAAQKQMNALEEGGLVESATRLDLLVNKVVLILPADSDADISSFEDVPSDKVSLIAIGDETVPVGQYTQEIYEFLGTWDAVSAKANLGTDVRAVLAWVETGDVDCGIVYATDAASSDLVKVVAEAPEGSHKAVIYPGAVLKDSANPEAARAFLDYLTTAKAVAIFEAAGFTMA